MSDNAAQFTPPRPLSGFDKKVIRRYLWAVVWPSATAVAIIAAILGYAARGLGEASAITTMYEHMTKPIMDGVQRVTAAEDAALRSKQDVERTATEVSDLRRKAQETLQQADNVLQQANIDSNRITELKGIVEKAASDAEKLKTLDYQKMTQTLMSDPQFAAALATVSDQRLQAIANQITQLKAALGTASTDVKIVPGRIMKCPDGYYMIGWSFQDQPGLDHGALWGPTATCARLNVTATP